MASQVTTSGISAGAARTSIQAQEMILHSISFNQNVQISLRTFQFARASTTKRLFFLSEEALKRMASLER
jgi:hypothetical protein